MSAISVDGSLVREMVEDFWRSYILFIRDLREKSPDASPEDFKDECLQFSRRTWARFEAHAALMSPEQGQAFLRVIDEEDSICSQEHHSNPDRFGQRLGLSPRSPQPVGPIYRRQGIGEMAVSTAVRATIWELIRSLFRR